MWTWDDKHKQGLVLDNLVEWGIMLFWQNWQKCCQRTIFAQRCDLSDIFRDCCLKPWLFFFSFCNGQPRRKNSVELITITWKTARFQGAITSSNDYSFSSATFRLDKILNSLPMTPDFLKKSFFMALLASRQEFNGDWAKMKLEKGSLFIILDALIQQKIRSYNEGGWNSQRMPAIIFLSFNLLNQSWRNAKLSSVPKFISLYLENLKNSIKSPLKQFRIFALGFY